MMGWWLWRSVGLWIICSVLENVRIIGKKTTILLVKWKACLYGAIHVFVWTKWRETRWSCCFLVGVRGCDSTYFGWCLRFVILTFIVWHVCVQIEAKTSLRKKRFKQGGQRRLPSRTDGTKWKPSSKTSQKVSNVAMLFVVMHNVCYMFMIMQWKHANKQTSMQRSLRHMVTCFAAVRLVSHQRATCFVAKWLVSLQCCEPKVSRRSAGSKTAAIIKMIGREVIRDCRSLS